MLDKRLSNRQLEGDRVEIINESELHSFAKKHSNARRPLANWIDVTKAAEWKSFDSAFLSGNRRLSKRAACRLAEYFKVSPALFLPKE